MTTFIDFHRLSLHLGGRPIVSDVTLRLQGRADKPDTPCIIGIGGRSGVGKTSLFKILVNPAFAKTAIKGGSATVSQGARITMVPQQPVFAENKGVLENINLFKHVAKQKNWVDDAAVDHLVKRLALGGILNRTDIASLSGGEAQRVMLARSLSLKPNILILDEPFNGIDPVVKRELSEVIVESALRYSILTIIISHNIADLKSICSDIIFFSPRENAVEDSSVYSCETLKFVLRPPTIEAAFYVGHPYAKICKFDKPVGGNRFTLQPGAYLFLGDRLEFGSNEDGPPVTKDHRVGASAYLSIGGDAPIIVPVEQAPESFDGLVITSSTGIARINPDNHRLEWTL